MRLTYKIGQFALLCCLTFTVSIAQQSALLQKLVASDRTFDMKYGSSASVYKNFAAVGSANRGTQTQSDVGAVYVYEKNASEHWVEIQKITVVDGQGGDSFGQEVFMTANMLLVGSPGEDEDSSGNNFIDKAGAVYVYQRNTNNNWALLQKIVSPDRTKGAEFGRAISTNNEYLIIGAPMEKHDVYLAGQDKQRAGAVYVFKINQAGKWQFFQKISPSSRVAGEEFGNAISLFEDQLIVGGYRYDEYIAHNCKVTWVGRAHIYNKGMTGEWEPKAVLKAPNIQQLEGFGTSVAIEGRYAVVGAPSRDVDIEGQFYGASGALYVFEKNKIGDWVFKQEILEVGPGSVDYLGCSIDMEGTRIVAGAFNKDFDTPFNWFSETGAAYVYDMAAAGVWHRTQILEQVSKANFDFMGTSVSLSQNTIFVTSPEEDHDENDDINSFSNNSGAAYVFEVPETIGINEVSSIDNLNLYPNPSRGDVNIKVDTDFLPLDVELYAASGELIQSFRFAKGSPMSLKLAGAKGMYYLTVKNNKGEVSSFKVLKR